MPINHSLRKQLEYAFSRSEYYKELFEKSGINITDFSSKNFNFCDLPFTKKAELVNDQVTYPPLGKLLAVPIYDIRRIHRTSGHSGNPFYIALTAKDINDTEEIGARTFQCAGIKQGDIIVHCLNYNVWKGGLTDHLSLERAGAAVIPFGVGHTHDLVELILRAKPSGISCTPSYIQKLESILANEFQISPRELDLRIGLFGGEPGLQEPTFRKRIEETWGIHAVDGNFGVSDVLSAFASECEYRNGLHFHGDGVLHVELINPNDSAKNIPFSAGAIGELVYTNLSREAQPLIRFRSSDLVEITGVGICECGRNGFRFRIIGRSDEMICVKGINFFHSALDKILPDFQNSLSSIFLINLVGNPPYHELNIMIEERKPLDLQEKKEIAGTIENKIKTSFSISAHISIVECDTLSIGENKARRIRRVE